MKAVLANHLWLASSRSSARKFHAAAHNVEETQSRLLKQYLTRNRGTEYLSQHPRELPLTMYDDYLPYVRRIADGEPNVLTVEPVELFELSSGSTAASKMIPYTRTLKTEFQRGLSAWISDLFTRHPSLRSGPAYWSISPLTDGPRRTRGGTPIGFEEDSAYLGGLGALVESALAVPNLVKHIRDVAAFRYITMLFLLRCEDLRLISVWNPTFLTLLLEPLPAWWDSLLRDIAEETITPPASIDEDIHRTLLKKFSRNAQRAKQLSRNAQRAKQLSRIQPTDYPSIWSHLRLISCWADGASKPYADLLQRQFPNVQIQPKGLLATEAFVTLPIAGGEGGVLAVTSHYFEFLTESGDLLAAYQVEKGRAYSVVLTTGGGLYRYQLNDLVEVVGFHGEAPRLKFIGKTNDTSDYFGEKLNEQFATNVLERLFSAHYISPSFYMLAPDDTDVFHYTLYLEAENHPDGLAAELDEALCQNFHYEYCRKLGQLAEVRIVPVKRGAELYLHACQSRGMKLGDIKPRVLQKTTGWGEWFDRESRVHAGSLDVALREGSR
jgi:hypothetical protein